MGNRSTATPTSIVQLGDSIASGEGTLYGYTYDTSSQEWTGGNIDAPWPPPYPLCHDSPDAYGNVVASNFNATFTQFACTGATFAAGISAPETSDGTELHPGREQALRPAAVGIDHDHDHDHDHDLDHVVFDDVDHRAVHLELDVDERRHDDDGGLEEPPSY